MRPLRAEVASLTDRNRRLEERGPEGVVEDLRARVASLSDQEPPARTSAQRAAPGDVREEVREAPPRSAPARLRRTRRPRSPRPRKRPRRTRHPRRARSVPAAERNLGHLPAHLPRTYELVEPGSTQCPCGCGEMVKIGEDRTERLDIVPAQLRVIVTIRPKYACRKCEEGVTQAPAPAHLVEGGLPTEGMLAHVLVSKFADHLPLYRLSQIFARSGIGAAPFDAGRLGRQGVVPPAARVRLSEGGAEDVEHPGAGPRPRSGCSTRAGARRRRATCGPWRATGGGGPGRTRRAWCMSMRPGAAASMARSCSTASGERCRSTAMPATTGWAGRSARAER